MKGLNIQSEKNQIVIKIDRDTFDKNYLLSLLERMNVEQLAKKADFDESILDVADEIKKNWWKEKGDNFIKNVKA